MKVYFAHPCFNEVQEKFKEEFLCKLRAALDCMEGGNDILIVDPFLHTPNIEGDTGAKIAMSGNVAQACLSLLGECEVVIALVDGGDTGTAFEAGYAHCMKMPVMLISEDACDTANAMLIGTAANKFDKVLADTGIKSLAGNLLSLYRAMREIEHIGCVSGQA